MRILLVHNFFQQFGSEDAIALAEKTLFQKHGEEICTYTRNNNEIRDYSPKEKLKLSFNAVYSRRTRRDISNVVQEHRPDVAYIHNFLPLISPSVYHTLYLKKVPSVQVVHEFRFLCPRSHFFAKGKICERCKQGNYLHAVRFRCYRNSYLESFVCASVLGINRLGGFLEKISGFICLTEFSRQKYMEVGVPEDKLFVKPHAIDAAEIQPQYKPGSYILYLGRLSDEKGLWTLIQAIGELREIGLKIVGTGPLEAELQKHVTEKKLTNIEFVGHKTGPEKWELLRNSLFVVVPSEWYETFCMVVIESYAAGKPVIGSNLGSLPYVIEDGKSGLLFQPGSVEDLREKVRYLLNRPGEIESLGRYGRSLVDTKYHPEENYKALMRIFSAVISR